MSYVKELLLSAKMMPCYFCCETTLHYFINGEYECEKLECFYAKQQFKKDINDKIAGIYLTELEEDARI